MFIKISNKVIFNEKSVVFIVSDIQEGYVRIYFNPFDTENYVILEGSIETIIKLNPHFFEKC